MYSKSGNSKRTDQRKTRRNAPCKWFKWPQGCNSLSPPMCLYTSNGFFFPPNKHLTCFTTFHLCGIYFLQSWSARALLLTNGLVPRIRCSQCRNSTSISVQELKLLQPKATETKPNTHTHTHTHTHTKGWKKLHWDSWPTITWGNRPINRVKRLTKKGLSPLVQPFTRDPRAFYIK